ncbi:MAG TPA: DUF3581 family protein, partial [Gammaproteobacteria bacterium]|nr:DUF3581 family protein [Gammaproteobacteria bacterium]
GDLLFALTLKHFGISKKMTFEFSGMVSDQTPLKFQELDNQQINICDNNDKVYLTAQRSGGNTNQRELINHFIQAYVGFSGQTFPHVLVPLMKAKGVMINPDRPLVIYNSMSLELDDLAMHQPSLELENSGLTVSGKRGDVCLSFNFIDAGKVVGHGEKNMVLSSLRDYDDEKIAQLVNTYNHRKETITE